ncbi:MAG TPA: ATP-binding protein, partial [Planctomycetota bacterium]|nr:ATP-binding protein [Planctomycetota bacterium]
VTEAQQTAIAELRESLDGPYVADSGQVFYQVSLPYEAADGRPAMLCAWLHPPTMLGRLISEAAPGYRLTVSDDTQLLYEQGTPPAARETPPDASEKAVLPVPLPLGANWQIELEPSDIPGLPASLSASQLVLATGMVMSVLLAGVVYLGQVSRVRARALSISNRQLRAQFVSTSVAEGRLRRLNESIEARVVERTRRLDEAVSELETFNYSVSHDLRSPIGAIVNFTSILAEDYKQSLDPAGHEILRRIGGCAESAVGMMDALLTFSHVGQQTMTPGPVAMKPLVEEVMVDLLLAHSGAAPAFRVGSLPDATADAVMMRTVWTNLLSNALKFTSSVAEPAIEINSQSTVDEHVYSVRDNGIGFEMKHATRLFKVFEQIHPTTGPKGHGVGLAIVNRIVRRHGGRAWAQAAPGKGATFYFSIPR